MSRELETGGQATEAHEPTESTRPSGSSERTVKSEAQHADRSNGSPLGQLSAILRAMRPHQWVKNVFVLAALVFAWGEHKNALPLSSLWSTLFALGAFCLGSSAIYLVNDVMDVESDRKHPNKKHRPIAAGEVAIPLALMVAAGCVAIALTLAWRASPERGSVALVIAAYMVLNLLYSLKLKHVVLVDAFCIASGFLLRVVGGGLAANTPVSHWLMLCTLFLALFLALCKRHAEIRLLGEERGSHRKILLEYTQTFLDQSVVVLAACAIICYTMYTVSEDTIAKFDTTELVWTVPFVVFGLFRYLLLVQTERGGGNPARVLLGGDVTFVVNCLAWFAVVLLILFGVI